MVDFYNAQACPSSLHPFWVRSDALWAPSGPGFAPPIGRMAGYSTALNIQRSVCSPCKYCSVVCYKPFLAVCTQYCNCSERRQS